jgi:hypothetical protein
LLEDELPEPEVVIPAAAAVPARESGVKGETTVVQETKKKRKSPAKLL